MLNPARQQALSGVLAADGAFLALVAEVDRAWARLRSVRAAILAVAKIAPLPGLMLARTQAEQDLDIDIWVPARGDAPTPNLVPIAADREMVEQWRSAAERLRDDASTELPEVKR